MQLSFLQPICDRIRSLTWNTVTPGYLLAAMVLFFLLLIGGLPLVRRKKLSALQLAGICLLVPYLFLVLSGAVFCRRVRKNHSYLLIPFWSYYQAFVLGKKNYQGYILRNLLMLFPLGLLFPVCSGGREKTGKRLVLLALGISCGIELMQLLLKRGTFELVDDPFNNLLGALLGFLVYKLIRLLLRKKEKQ